MGLFSKKKINVHDLLESMDKHDKKVNPVYDMPIENNIPNVINSFRKSYKGRKINELVDNYYHFKDILQESNPSDISKHLEYCLLSFGLIEPLIFYHKQITDLKVCQIRSFPCLDFSPRYIALQGMRGQLTNIKDIVYFFEELEDYKQIVDVAYCILELRPQIFKFIKENNGMTNKEFEQQFPNETEFIGGSILSGLEMFGQLKSDKRKGRYKLYEIP